MGMSLHQPHILIIIVLFELLNSGDESGIRTHGPVFTNRILSRNVP
jgi:hypothetical protein